MKKVIFTLAEARSGTLYLRNLFRLNARDCDCRHETFFDIGNPTMFGPAIYDAYAGRFGKIRARLEKKRRYIQRLPGSSYIESSHAFLKSSRVAALDFFPDLRLVHLVRDPLKVAASEAYRELWRRRLHAPFHFYRGDDGKRHFAWALTGNEQIFQHFAGETLTLFQWYLIQWVEIENRAMDFLHANQLHDRCYTLHSPQDLNDPAKIRGMFDFLGVPTMNREIAFGGRKNKSIGYFMAPAQKDNEARSILGRLPQQYLHIFRNKPYCDYHWSALFNGNGTQVTDTRQAPENCRLPRQLSQLTC
ncbi:MAG TPA: hypothetical protein VGY98_00305 [Verrucomicrobiae bacterium]|nr:hypothetical protein [Verrucomicrobiae bacterium]